jgi:hypothetical protein
VPPSKGKAFGGALLKRLLGVLVVVGLGIAFALYRASGATAPKVGDCIDHVSGNEIRVVECTDAAVDMKVIGVVGNQTEAQFDNDESCAAFPDTDASYFESGGRGVTNGYVLCLVEK